MSIAAAAEDTVPGEALAKLAEAIEPPAENEGHDAKVQRYTRAIRLARSYLAEYSDADDLYKVRKYLLLALQARVNLDTDAETYRRLLETARTILDGNAPRDAKLEADLVLMREKFRPDEMSEHEIRMAILDFVGRYRDSGVGEKALMYGGNLAGAEGDGELLDVLKTELRWRAKYWDRAGVTGFLRRNSGLDLSGRFFKHTLNRLDGGTLRLPSDTMGKPTLFLFWTADNPNVRQGLDSLKAFYEKHRDAIEIVSVSLDEARQDLVQFVRSRELDWIHTFSGRALNDPFAWTYGISGVPSALFMDPVGRGRHIQGMQGWYTNKRSSTAFRGYGGPINTLIKDYRDFENFHDASHHYLAGEFPIRMEAGLFTPTGEGPGEVPADAMEKLRGLIHAIRNSPAATDKVGHARAALKLALELERAHAGAPTLYAVRNAGLVAARVLAIRAEEADARAESKRLAEAVMASVEDKEAPVRAGLIADYVLTERRLTAGLAGAQAERERITSFVEHYAGTPADTAAALFGALLAVQVGNDALVQDAADRLEQPPHLDAPQTRSFLRYVVERYVDRGKPFEATLQRMDGSPLTLPDDLRGKPVVVCFWTAEAIRAHRRMPEPGGRWRAPPYTGLSPSEHEDLVVVGVNLDESPEAARKMMEGELADWIHTRPDERWRAPLVERLDIHDLPSTWLIDRDGYLVADDMLAARLRSGILAAAMHQPAPHRIRERMINQWRVLGPFHQRANDDHTETGFARASPALQTPQARSAWFNIQAWRNWPFSHLEHQFTRRFSHASFPPARAERVIDFDKTHDDGDGKRVAWRAVEADRAGFVNLDRAYPDRPAPAIAYAVAYVHSKTGGAYHAVLSNTYDTKLRVNGEEKAWLMTKVREGENHHKPVWWAGQSIDRRWAERQQGADAKMPRHDKTLLRKTRLKLDLRKGWNEIFIKSADARGDWRFQMRIADPDRTLRYALHPGDGPEAFAGVLPKWTPPAPDDLRNRVLETFDHPRASKLTGIAAAIGKFNDEARVSPAEARCLDGPALMRLMHQLDLWEPADTLRQLYPDAGPMQLALEALDPDKAFEPIAARLENAIDEYNDPDTHHHRRRALRRGEMDKLIRAIGIIGNEPATRLLLDLLKQQHQRRKEGNAQSQILRPVVRAAGKVGDEAFLPYLAPLLDSDNKRLRQDTMKAMLAIGTADPRHTDRLIKLLQDLRHGGRYLAKVGTSAARKRLEQNARNMTEGHPEDIFAIRAVHHLESYEHEAVVDEMTRFLKLDHMHVRRHTMQALGRLGFHTATPALLEAFEDPANGDLRTYIATALRKIGGPRAEPVFAGLLDSASHALRTEAARGLRATGAGEASIAKLIAALGDAHWLVRAEAARSLGALEAEQAIDPLIGRLDDENADVRAAAATALGELGAESARDRLADHLADWHVGPHAAAALDQLGWSPGEDRAARVRHRVAHRRFEALRKDWEATRAALLSDLESGGRAGVNAAFALIALGRDATVPQLKAHLQRSDDPTVAAAFLNSGQPTLEAAATRWAESNGFTIRAARTAAPVRWNGE